MSFFVNVKFRYLVYDGEGVQSGDERIAAAGDELGLHYNAVPVDRGSWGAEEFARQAAWFRATSGQQEITSNKNHLTRFEGWGELFRWCEENGVASDQTRGNSREGERGTLFGTCHPYFPMAWFDERNRLYDVLEISFLYGDFLSLDTSLIAPFLGAGEADGRCCAICFSSDTCTPQGANPGLDAQYREGSEAAGLCILDREAD